MRIRIHAALLLLAALAGCAGIGGPKTITLDAADLQRLVERRFPLERRWLEVLDVTAEAPRLTLLAERHRLATELSVQVRDRLFGGRWRARLAANAALRYEPRDQSVRLQQVRVDGFSLDDGAPSGARAQTERLAALLAERVLEDMPVYTLPPDKLEQLHRFGLEPGAVSVTSRGVEITLAPTAR